MDPEYEILRNCQEAKKLNRVHMTKTVPCQISLEGWFQFKI